MLEILQVAGIIGLLVFSCMRIFASNTAHFWGYDLVCGAAIMGICWAFFEAPPGEALVAALITTAVAHLLSALVTRRRSARNTTTDRFTRTTSTPTPTPSFTRITTTTSARPKAAPAKPAAPKAGAPVTKPVTLVAKMASTETPKPQQPKTISTTAGQPPKIATPKPITQAKAEKKEVNKHSTAALNVERQLQAPLVVTADIIIQQGQFGYFAE